MFAQNSKSRIFSKFAAFIYICGICWVGIAAFRQGGADYYANRARRSGDPETLQLALSFDSSNPEIYKTGGLLALESKDFGKASLFFEKAVLLKPNDFMLWLRLGRTRYLNGDLTGAEAAYRRSLELAPDYAQPNLYLGRLLLKNGDLQSAFRYLGRAAELDRENYPETLDLARRQFPDNADQIESLLQPESSESKKIIAFYFIKHSLMTVRLKEYLTGDLLTESEKNEFIFALLNKKNFQAAQEVWLSQTSRQAMPVRPADEYIFDGGFEYLTENDKTGFGWTVNQKISDVAVQIDDSIKLTGQRSIRIKLNGKTELNTKILSQLVVVEPFQKYSLNFSVLSSDIVSARSLAVFAVDRIDGRILGQSAEIKNSNGKWESYQFDFQTGDSAAVEIILQRPACSSSPCPIFGNLSIDDFSLKRRN